MFIFLVFPPAFFRRCFIVLMRLNLLAVQATSAMGLSISLDLGSMATRETNH